MKTPPAYLALRQTITRAGAAAARLVRPSAPAAVGIERRPEQSQAAGLVSDFAIEQFARMLTRVPDPDEMLRRAGLRRHDLRSLEYDDEISGALETRREAVLLTQWRIDHDGDEDAVKFIRAEVASIFGQIVGGAWEAVPYGYSVSEAVYQQRADGRIGIARCSTKPMQWFEPLRDGRLLMSRPGAAERIELDRQTKFVLTVRNGTYANPYGEALLSRLYWPWFFRHNGWRAWMQFVERFGDPFVVGHSETPTELVTALLGMGVKNVIGVGATDKLEVMLQTGGDIFDKLDSRLSERILKTILGQTLTSGTSKSGGGSYALGQVHNQVRNDKRLADCRMLAPAVQWVVDALWRLNAFDGKPPQFLFFDPADIALERSQRDVALAGAGIVAFTKPYLLKAYGFEDGDIDLPVAPPPGMPPAGNAKGLAELALVAEHAPRARGRRTFTPAQEAVERLGDAALANAPDFPIALADLRAAIIGATDAADLELRLAALIDRTDPLFEAALARAMFAADVLGYVHADEGV